MEIRKGVFQLYENDSLFGEIYRSGNYQIENYFTNKDVIAKIDHLSDSTFILKGIEENPKGLDSTTFLVTYKQIDVNHYAINAKLINMNTNYLYQGKYVKVSDEIPEKYAKKLDSLNKK
jgi:hypothetical protein